MYMLGRALIWNKQISKYHIYIPKYTLPIYIPYHQLVHQNVNKDRSARMTGTNHYAFNIAVLRANPNFSSFNALSRVVNSGYINTANRVVASFST